MRNQKNQGLSPDSIPTILASCPRVCHLPIPLFLYFEVMVDEVAPFLTAQATHLRVGWALTEGYSPYPGGGEGWGGNGVGDDLYSYGFDGLHLWTGTWTLLGDPQP